MQSLKINLDPIKQEPLSEDNVIVHSVWIGDRLSLLECLTIKLLQSHGHIVHLWAYESIKNIPENVILRDAREILPKDTIFGHAGSFSHWSDQFQMKLLEIEGGIYIQLDVATLKPLNFVNEFVFFPHMPGNGIRNIAPYLMKCPKNSKFASETYKKLASTINGNTIKSMHWDYSMKLINESFLINMPDCEKYFVESKNFMDLGGGHSPMFFRDIPLNPDVFVIHWSNFTHNKIKHNPISNSVYYKLLKSVNLM